ncbi:hypothetical protein PHOBOS_247 [Erwinia phage vB_EamM_Phobos]|uniref:hypothetical protein n=1 Tax=Erwinia phage vB_EamM_Phobos TaxID=1883377 RepID=UPI00081D0469|nr:hypothetical protein BIZ79_gp247 [Erwinia phage vB_EamM_Phobos]ANZ50437.1 hypothetical protein PHOBOS_247 [Erwinia phage vB_EamM_Phobos]
MMLHLVEMNGTKNEYLLNAGLYIPVSVSPAEVNPRRESLLDSLKRVGIPHSTREVFLLEHRYEDRNAIRCWLFVPEPGRTDIVEVDADRTYAAIKDVVQWTKGDENPNSRLFSLYKLRTTNEITWKGYGEAAGAEPARQWFLDIINQVW